MDARSKPGLSTGAVVGAAVLIVVGVAALVANLGGGEAVLTAIPLAIGIAFALVYGFNRHYGFLVPAGILTGIGAGLVAGYWLGVPYSGPYVAIGSGLGFIGIFAVDLLVSRSTQRWWPVIPGAVLVAIGGVDQSAKDSFTRGFQAWSPVLLIAIGLAVLLVVIRRPAR